MATEKEAIKTKKTFSKSLRRGLYISVAIPILLFVWTMIQVERAAGTSSNQKADAAIVLGAAAWGKNPSPVFKERIRHAVDLYQQQRVEILIFTGGTIKEGYRSEALVGRDYAIKLGVPEQDIVIEDNSRDTYENFLFTKKEIRNLSLATFLVVSDPYHMYRSMMIAKDTGYVAYPSPTPSSKFNAPKGQFKFLLNETFASIAYKVQRLFKGVDNI